MKLFSVTSASSARLLPEEDTLAVNRAPLIFSPLFLRVRSASLRLRVENKLVVLVAAPSRCVNPWPEWVFGVPLN